MSKLYATIDSDARKSQATSRGHKWVKVAAMHNFTGGQEPEGILGVTADHDGDRVIYDVVYFDRFRNVSHPIGQVLVNKKGDVKISP